MDVLLLPTILTVLQIGRGKGDNFPYFFCLCDKLPMCFQRHTKKLSELQIRGGIEDNSKIIFLISQQKHIL